MTPAEKKAREIVIRGMDPRVKWETEDYRLKELITQALEAAYQDGFDASKRLSDVENAFLQREIRELEASRVPKEVREALKFYARHTEFPLTEIINAFQSGGSTHDTLKAYTGRAKHALALLDKEG